MNTLLIKTSFAKKLLLLFLLLNLLHGCKKEDNKPPKANEESADVVYAWYHFIARMQLNANPQPVVQLLIRNFGYIGVGLYESVQPGVKGATSLSNHLYQMPQMPQADKSKDYSWSASANAALASMFRLFLTGLTDANKSSIDSMEAAQNNRLGQFLSHEVLSRSQAFGRAVATAIFNWSTTDNFVLSSAGYTPPVCASCWVPTPPAFAAPVGAFLKNSRPFLKYSLTASAPPLPVPYSEDKTSQFYKAAKEVYDVGKTLTDEQKAIANWWADAGGPGVGLPAPHHIMSIITSVLESQKAKLAKAAEVYAKTGIGMRDGNINTFRAKYQYNLLRPVTYIQRHIDPTWQTYLPTPPYPEYTSGLAGLYMPAIQVLIRTFGDIPVTDDAYAWRGLAPRRFGALSELAREMTISRVYAGIHYRFTQFATLDVGRQLGNVIADIRLVPPTHGWKN